MRRSHHAHRRVTLDEALNGATRSSRTAPFPVDGRGTDAHRHIPAGAVDGGKFSLPGPRRVRLTAASAATFITTHVESTCSSSATARTSAAGAAVSMYEAALWRDGRRAHARRHRGAPCWCPPHAGRQASPLPDRARPTSSRRALYDHPRRFPRRSTRRSATALAAPGGRTSETTGGTSSAMARNYGAHLRTVAHAVLTTGTTSPCIALACGAELRNTRRPSACTSRSACHPGARAATPPILAGRHRLNYFKPLTRASTRRRGAHMDRRDVLTADEETGLLARTQKGSSRGRSTSTAYARGLRRLPATMGRASSSHARASRNGSNNPAE